MIRKINEADRQEYLEMTKIFYESDAVSHNIDEKHRTDTFEELMKSEEYAMCYMMEYDGKVAGYALLAKTFSQEAGGLVIWIEEIYTKPEYRGRGLGKELFTFLRENLTDGIKRLRLEVESDNIKAISLYERMGYEVLDYMQMIQDL